MGKKKNKKRKAVAAAAAAVDKVSSSASSLLAECKETTAAVRASASKNYTSKTASDTSSSAATAAGAGAVASDSRHEHLLPLPFPSHLPRPAHSGFLRNEPPFTASFAAAVETAYEGFCVDENVVLGAADNFDASTHNDDEDDAADMDTEQQQQRMRLLQRTLTHELRDHFRTDVTQPFGLGTACSPTYVTRCLAGDAGTTYKYLGLRLFSLFPWPEPVARLKDALTERVARVHVPALRDKRAARGVVTGQRGHSRAAATGAFDVCLINRMAAGGPAASNNSSSTSSSSSKHLKKEPLDPTLRTTVSWHADSSLEHYSTIAVYQMLIPSTPQSLEKKKNKSSDGADGASCRDGTGTDHDKDWWIALRVAPNAEGPGSTCLRTAIGSEKDTTSAQETAPPIAVSLPSNSAYYLLDDFNHHHQHTVLTSASSSSSVRYSLTFRLLRDSHNVAHVLERCARSLAKGFCRTRGTKVYRSEQLLLTELESEWLRQFYVQGSRHRDLLWPTGWGASMQQLWHYWSQLEQRTHQTVAFLRHAAEGRCLQQQQQQHGIPTNTHPTTTKAERKLRDKRRKAAAAMQEVFDRESSFASRGSDQGDVTSISIYESVAGLLEERALMRELWAKRETDHAFRDMSVEDRPLPLPCKYGVVVSVEEKVTVTTNSNEQLQLGVSPMPGTPEELRKLAADLRAMGRAYVSGTSSDLPELMLMSEPAEAKNDNNHEHAKADDWSGWNDLDFGLEMQSPWARALLEGRKTIETRAYDLPPALLGKRIAVIETPKGKQAGVSAMGNHVDFERSDEAKIVGWCKFSSVKKYTNSRDFERDEKAHLVHNASGYGWNVGTTKAIYGWVVGECGVENHSSCKSATRRLRSLYQLIPRGSCDNDCKLPGTASRKRQQGMAKKQSDSGCKKKKRRF